MFKKTASIVLGTTILLTSVGMGVHATTNDTEAKATPKSSVKNVIMMVPDGYSTAYATNYRWYKGKESTMDSLLVGMVRTHSANTEVTDSAAAGTAYATGVKTNNGMVSVTPQGKELKTVLEGAESKGKSTGLVVTSSLTDATPAAFSSHVTDRNNEVAIPSQILSNNVDVILGGGKDFFLPEKLGGKQTSQNLVEKAKKQGYQYVETEKQLANAKGKKVLGLFADEGMSPELDRETTKEPSLATMTTKALDTLKKDKDGFFLMVEGSQIDWAGHSHDAARAMKDAESFEKAVEEVVKFAKKDGNTLVVIAGDHDTGGMSVGGYDQYDTKVDILRNVTASAPYIESKFNKDFSNVKEVVKQYTKLDLTDEEVQRIKDAKQSNGDQPIKDSDNVAYTISNIISERALIGWTSKAHTGTDVPLYAYGKGAQSFSGLKQNTDIANLLAKAMNVNLN
ncbi:alkaline phosphatase [Priestia megaterium]|uniref:alkaline phosphatase n=1 Tax=Priestia megaterium TaxID=1404 RepID=UPI001A94ADAC|nr:alkaline phosphatase [Priestia megaterium]QSX24298.1 alkaline phosphatase [Priestia megaterium]